MTSSDIGFAAFGVTGRAVIDFALLTSQVSPAVIKSKNRSKMCPTACALCTVQYRCLLFKQSKPVIRDKFLQCNLRLKCNYEYTMGVSKVMSPTIFFCPVAPIM